MEMKLNDIIMIVCGIKCLLCGTVVHHDKEKVIILDLKWKAG